MSKVKEITVSVTRVIKTGDYENFQTTITEVVEIESKDIVKEVRQEKLNELVKVLDKKEKEIRKTFTK